MTRKLHRPMMEVEEVAQSLLRRINSSSSGNMENPKLSKPAFSHVTKQSYNPVFNGPTLEIVYQVSRVICDLEARSILWASSSSSIYWHSNLVTSSD